MLFQQYLHSVANRWGQLSFLKGGSYGQAYEGSAWEHGGTIATLFASIARFRNDASFSIKGYNAIVALFCREAFFIIDESSQEIGFCFKKNRRSSGIRQRTKIRIRDDKNCRDGVMGADPWIIYGCMAVTKGSWDVVQMVFFAGDCNIWRVSSMH